MALYKKFLAIIICISAVVLVSYLKLSLLYHPVPASKDKYFKFTSKLEQLVEKPTNLINTMIPQSDGNQIHLIHLINPTTDKTIIFFHGNAGNISMRFDIVKFLYLYGSVVIFDYRAYGMSSGEKSILNSHTLQEDGMEVWRYATTVLKVPTNKVVLFGESLGCSVAIWVAMELSRNLDSNLYPIGLVLNSTFHSIESMLHGMLSKINLGPMSGLINCLLGSEYELNEWMKMINPQTRIIFAHSPRDEIIPYQEAQKLYLETKAILPKTKFVNIQGTHNNLGLTDAYIYALSELFQDE